MLALVCPSKRQRRTRATQDEQAVAAGISRRHFIRLIREKWEAWPVDKAVRWCEYCGLDYWNLSTAQVDPRALRLTTWDLKDPRVREALELSCKARDVEASPERLAKLVQALTLASQNYGGVGTSVRG